MSAEAGDEREAAVDPPFDLRRATAVTAGGGSEMTRGMVALFAVACGISVANLYYAQPLLPLISRQFHIGSGTADLVVTAAQIGYGIGLALIVPLGDMLVRRRLVPGILVVAALAPVLRG